MFTADVYCWLRLGNRCTFGPRLGKGDDSRRCETCFGAGEVEVCEGCGERPTVICGVEACGCTYLTTTPAACEICERTVSAAELDNANVCTHCRDEMAAKIQREADEHQAWVAEQLDFGRQAGWL